ncbi:uncharacterized protein EI90DRAFT_2972626 [Cantharellus anzutake]|uniref:uncharacterized protein n=1 Tax=Cantharellus anzutake TaxID=1750568 RepID=UPI001908F8B6|nr:uncharacterized protein EI90DRAFT_2972626 [Cantharellus anzutake]KAF8331512.1 hypothetical protein EI90DRAFT_2972626 [Cantharellus anzutake]
MDFVLQPPVHRVLCADCGDVIEPNSANLCVNCLRNSVDITEGIPKQSSVSYCRNCERYLAPPATWSVVQLESRELLAICLKKLKGLNRVRLIDAGFIWTEPHSKRLRVKLTIQKEVFTSTILQQIFEVEYIIQYGQCPDCSKLAAKNTWKALVQVRQKVSHKRTFLYLEQLILKHGADKDTISIKEVKDGLDFYFSQRSHAIKMVDFLSAVVPIRQKISEQLLSADTHSNTANFKFTYSVEIIPICRDDLICLTPKQARGFSSISPLTLCSRVGNSLHLIDPSTLSVAEVASPVYWRNPFESLATVSDLVEFTILDIELSGTAKGKWLLADAQVAPASAFRSGGVTNDIDMDDIGGTDAIYHTRTHLGAILHPGDSALGYFISRSNFNSDAFDELDPGRIPDIILVKKKYQRRKRRGRPRNWKLKSIAKEAEEIEEGTKGSGRGAIGRRGGLDQARVEADYELFLQELEEDPELRGAVNLYKVSNKDAKAPGTEHEEKGKVAFAMDVEPTSTPAGADEESEAGEDDGDFPEIKMEELLDEFEGLGITDGDTAGE